MAGRRLSMKASAEGKGLRKKNPHAVALGRLGGRKGGRARARKLSAERRRQIARKAINTRWNRARRPPDRAVSA